MRSESTQFNQWIWAFLLFSASLLFLIASIQTLRFNLQADILTPDEEQNTPIETPVEDPQPTPEEAPAEESELVEEAPIEEPAEEVVEEEVPAEEEASSDELSEEEVVEEDVIPDVEAVPEPEEGIESEDPDAIEAEGEVTDETPVEGSEEEGEVTEESSDVEEGESDSEVSAEGESDSEQGQSSSSSEVIESEEIELGESLEEVVPEESPKTDDLTDKDTLLDGMLVAERSNDLQNSRSAGIRLADLEIEGKSTGEDLTLNEALEAVFAVTTKEEDFEKAIIRSVLKSEADSIEETVSEDRGLKTALEKSGKKSLLESPSARLDETVRSGQFQKTTAETLEDDDKVEEVLTRMATKELKEDILKKTIEASLESEDFSVLTEDVIAEVIKDDFERFNLEAELTRKLKIDKDAQDNLIEVYNSPDTKEKTAVAAPLIKVSVTGQGQFINIPLEAIRFESGSLIMVLDLPRKFKPGLYQAQIEFNNPITESKEILIQDFLWGVLAVNPNKDLYRPNSIGIIDIGVLDDEGVPVCDATVSLEIITPEGTSSQPLVENTGQCEVFDSANTEPDYQASYTLGSPGEYIVKTTAVLPDGRSRFINSTITVAASPSYSIEREAATRLYPVGKSPMTLKVSFKDDFSGQISDFVPVDFSISNISSTDEGAGRQSTIDGGQIKQITWSLAANAGEIKSLSYAYDAPDISPEFYTLGPAEIVSDATPEVFYEEKRQWQIANDEPSIGADADDLLGNWQFNTGSGTTAFDSSSYANNGSLTNMEGTDWITSTPANTNGNPYALDFDGSNEFVSVTDPAGGELDFSGTADFTITGWFNRDTSTTDDTIVAKRNGTLSSNTGYIIYIPGATDVFTFEVSDGTNEYSIATRTEFITTGWRHFAVVWDQDNATNSTIYINGVQEDGLNTAGTIGNVGSLANSVAFRMGAESDGGAPFDGKLDDIRIYNRVLSSTEIGILAGGNDPAGVTADLALWLKADEGVTTSGSDVSSWLDQTGSGYAFTQGTTANQPDLTSDVVNTHPAITFDGSNDVLSSATFLEQPLSVFSIIRNTDTGTNERTFFGMESDELGSDDGVYMKANNASGNAEVAYLLGGALESMTTTSLDNQFYLHTGLLNSSSNVATFKVNGGTVDSTTGAGKLADLTEAAIGAGFVSDALTGYFVGDIAEILVYNEEKTGTNLQKIESYLALKYGLTLDQSPGGGGTNYLNSSGSTIWIEDSGDSFENDIAGIGQDDLTALYQVSSISQNSDAILRVADPSALSDLEFFIWANNNGPATWTSTDAPTDYKILTRQWGVQETSDVGTVDIEFDVEDADFDVPDLQGAGGYYLVYDSDTDGSLSDETPVAMVDDGSSGDDTGSDDKWTAQVNVPTGAGDPIYFTLATFVDPVPTVTDANISINSGSGTGNAFIVGDQIIVTWDNSATGDNNTALTTVTADLSGWGGLATTTMTDTTACSGTASDDVYEACYTLVAGAIDTTNVNASVTASSLSGQTSTSDTSNATVDNEPPTVSTGAISVTGATGTGGAFKVGDTATGRWDDSATGDSNGDTIASVSFNLANFRSTDTAVSGSNASDIWTASITGALDTQGDTNNNVTVTATDNAGNQTTTAGTNNYTIDTSIPSISGITSVAGDTGSPYYDTSNDGSTAIVFTSTDVGTGLSACRWDEADVAYASMANNCSSTSNCTADLTGEEAKTVYITCIDGAGNETASSTQVDYTIDATAPAGASITPAATRIIDTSNPSFNVSDGTDGGTGIDTSSRLLERRDATYTSNSCGAFGAYATVAYSGTYPNISDATVSGSNCYEYRWTVSDVAGNSTSATTATIVRVPLDTITITAGDGQSYGGGATNPIGHTLATALQVQITDGGTNTALADEVTVDFSISSVPGSPTATGQSLSAASDTTDASGFAEVSLTLGDRAGDYEVEATSSDAAIVDTVTFTETAGQYFTLVVTEDDVTISLDPSTNPSDSASPTLTITTNAASFQVYLTPDQWPTSVALDQILNWAASLGFGWSLNAGSITAFTESVGDPDATLVYSCSGDSCQGANVVDVDIHAGIDFTYPAGDYTSDLTYEALNINY